ncbi:Leucine-rich repeat-containing protein 4B [Halotydeus destructor]|nr:Leucine-rich repeat-containing protein 4B [Halotydeus destructor]
MASLWTLDLSHCDIELIEPKAFNDLTQLKNLHLNDNKLRVLAGSVVEPLVHVDQLNLNLHGNHWICDCRLRDLRHWMLSFTPTCDYPSRLTGRSWSDLELDEFACPPELSVPSGQVYSFEGEDARLECIGRSIPSAAIDWFWKGRPIGNLSLMSFGRQMYLIKETVKGTDKTSSLYIVNAMPKDSGSYTCRASNKAGTLMSNVSLEVTLSKRDQVVEQSGQSMVGLVLAIVLVLTVILLAVMYVVIRHKQAIVSTFQSSERKDVIVNHHQNGRPGTSGRAASGQQQIETVIASQAALSSLATMANGQRQASGSSLSPITVPMAIMAANLASDDEAPPPPAPNQDYLQMTSNDIQDRNKYNVRLTEMYNRKSTPPDIMDNNGLFRPNGGPVTSPVLI